MIAGWVHFDHLADYCENYRAQNSDIRFVQTRDYCWIGSGHYLKSQNRKQGSLAIVCFVAVARTAWQTRCLQLLQPCNCYSNQPSFRCMLFWGIIWCRNGWSRPRFMIWHTASLPVLSGSRRTFFNLYSMPAMNWWRFLLVLSSVPSIAGFHLRLRRLV